jgi:hypothetical protein
MIDRDALPSGRRRGSWRHALGVGLLALFTGPPIGALGFLAWMTML